MQYEIIEKKVLSSNGRNMLAGTVYLPEGEIKGYFHIVHGMTEYIGRYDSFIGRRERTIFIIVSIFIATSCWINKR